MIELGSNSSSAKFEAVGETVAGVIVRADQMQQTDMETGEPVFWDAAQTRPKMMPVVTVVAPGHRDANEDGEVTVYLSGGRFSAVRAVTKQLEEGGHFSLTFAGLSDREPSKRGYNRAKRYTATYTPPTSKVSLDSGAPVAPASPNGAPPF